MKTVSGGLGEIGTCPMARLPELNYPIGIGVILFGADGWVVKNNNIFGNYKWGAAAFSDPLGNEGDDAESQNNRFIDNKMGRGGTDLNGTSVDGADFWVDGSGDGNCFVDNGAGSTFDPSATAPRPTSTRPAPRRRRRPRAPGPASATPSSSSTT